MRRHNVMRKMTRNPSHGRGVPKGTMFQMIGYCGKISDFYSIFQHVGDSCAIFANLKGNLGTSAELRTLLEGGISSQVIGSVKFSFEVDGTKASALVFNTGTCKICGGFPESVKDSFDVQKYNRYLDQCKESFELTTKLNLTGTKIICINGQFQIENKLSNLSELDEFISIHRLKFDHVKQPSLDNRGRRGAYKLYLYGKKKTHIAVDYKGTCQVFACKSVEELFQSFNKLS